MKWIRKSAGVRLALLTIGVILLFGIGVSLATTRTVSWNAVTTYTDGSLIEAGNAVTYSVWRQDSVTLNTVQLSNHIAAISQTFDDSSLVKGRVYKFWAQAQLATGASSDNSAQYSWTLPLGQAATPAGLNVQ